MRWTSLAGLLWLTASVGHAQSSVDAALQTADAHAQEGDHRAAIAVLETARAETPSARLDLSLAVNLAATGSLRDAATLLRALIDAGTNPLVAEVARERLAAIPDTSISGRRVAHELTTLIERRGKPGMIVSDKGTELTSNAILTFAATQRIEWH